MVRSGVPPAEGVRGDDRTLPPTRPEALAVSNDLIVRRCTEIRVPGALRLQARIGGYGSGMEKRPNSLKKELGQSMALIGTTVALVFAVLLAGLGL